MNREDDLKRLKEAAVSAVVHWAQTGRGELNMRSQVNGYMAASGADTSVAGEVGIALGRKAVAQELLRECITPLTSENYAKAKPMLLNIAAEDAPRPKRGIGL